MTEPGASYDDELESELLPPSASKAPELASGKTTVEHKVTLSGPVKAFAAGALAVGVILGITLMGNPGAKAPEGMTGMPSNHPAVTALPTSQATPVDEAKANELKAKVKANPKDKASLKALADMYAAAEEDAQAIEWQNKVVEVEPTNTDERTILGVFYFNNSDTTNAEKQWLEVTRQDPKKTAAYFNLGYLYLVTEPPQNDKAIKAWQKVMELEPNSDMAKQVETHIGAIQSASPAPTATPSR